MVVFVFFKGNFDEMRNKLKFYSIDSILFLIDNKDLFYLDSPQWRSTISTQTETTSLSKSYDDIRINGHPQCKIELLFK